MIRRRWAPLLLIVLAVVAVVWLVVDIGGRTRPPAATAPVASVVTPALCALPRSTDFVEQLAKARAPGANGNGWAGVLVMEQAGAPPGPAHDLGVLIAAEREPNATTDPAVGAAAQRLTAYLEHQCRGGTP